MNAGSAPAPQASLLGDTFGSLLCDCNERLERAAANILAAAGILVYLMPDRADPLTCRATAAT
jgi:GTP cyclohydrolase II